MIGLFIAALTVVLPLIHLALTKAPRTRARVVRILLLYALIVGVGVMGLLFGFVPHIFFPDETAKMIGWSPSPFQFEVGIHDGAWGVLGLWCIWIGGLLLLATGLGWSPVSYTHLRAHETRHDLVCRLLLEKKKNKTRN